MSAARVMVSNQCVSKPRAILIVLTLTLVPLLLFFWKGYVEVYRQIDTADVRVNGTPAGFAHHGRVSAIVTRTDVAGGHSYRIWPTGKEMLIFDCHNWTAPSRRYFLQGRVSEPCSLQTNASVPTLAAPVTHGIVKDGILSFTTRDGKVVSLRSPY
jgi:hypothetical protein